MVKEEGDDDAGESRVDKIKIVEEVLEAAGGAGDRGLGKELFEGVAGIAGYQLGVAIEAHNI